MNFFKKRGVAWGLTIVMILLAVCIGWGRSSVATPTPNPSTPAQTVVPLPEEHPTVDSYYVCDNAGVLSDSEIHALSQRNRTLMNDMNVVIGCVTVNYGGDLGSYAMEAASDLDLAEYDFIVVLDISGDNYWLVQGSGLVDVFTDDDCGDYAYSYLEKDFAAGRYGDALLDLTQALSDWYYANYNG